VVCVIEHDERQPRRPCRVRFGYLPAVETDGDFVFGSRRLCACRDWNANRSCGEGPFDSVGHSRSVRCCVRLCRTFRKASKMNSSKRSAPSALMLVWYDVIVRYVSFVVRWPATQVFAAHPELDNQSVTVLGNRAIDDAVGFCFHKRIRLSCGSTVAKTWGDRRTVFHRFENKLRANALFARNPHPRST